MSKKPKPIPAVPFDVLIMGHEAVIEDRDRLGPGGPTISLIRALQEEEKLEVIIAVDYRLRALAKLIREGEGKPWTSRSGPVRMNETCKRCFGTHWVCEAHPHMAWEGDYACGCGAPGMPCPLCNASDEVTPPKMPPGFIEDDGA